MKTIPIISHPNASLKINDDAIGAPVPDACSPRKKRELHSLPEPAFGKSLAKPTKKGLARYMVTLESSQKGKRNPMKKVAVTAVCRFAVSAILLCCVLASSARAQYTVGQRVWTPPAFGNYFSTQLGGTNFPPAPFFPYDPLVVPVYSLNGSNSFIYDDTDFRSLMMSENVPPAPGEGGGGDNTNSIAPAYSTYGSNDLWLEINVTNNPPTFAFLTLHGTQTNLFYQLLSSLDLGNPRWTPGEIIQNTNGTNVMLFAPVPADAPAMFFKAVGGQVIASIDRVVDAIEPVTTNETGQIGLFAVSLSESLSDDLNVTYAVSGTASNGVDYTNLTGTVTIPANGGVGIIFVDPKFDNLIEFDESVLLSLVPRSGYVVGTNHAKASIFIEDNIGTNTIFEIVATNLQGPVGIAYHPLTNALIVSVSSFSTQSFDFVRIGTNTPAGFVTNWSQVHEQGGDEKKIEIVNLPAGVFTNESGFTNGSMFFGTPELGVIGTLSANSSASNLNWVQLPVGLFRGGFHIDTSGSFGGDLIAVTASSGGGTESVWRIKADGTTNRVAAITTSHLEGVITLTNDVSRWGPWAGKIITGNEEEHKIFAVDTNGVSVFALEVNSEDFDLIPTNQDLYCCDVDEGTVVRLSKTLLNRYSGNLLITQAGETPSPFLSQSSVFMIGWDGADFLVTRARYFRANGDPGHFEHVTFAPIQLPVLSH